MDDEHGTGQRAYLIMELGKLQQIADTDTYWALERLKEATHE